jgi:hypothetical protein
VVAGLALRRRRRLALLAGLALDAAACGTDEGASTPTATIPVNATAPEASTTTAVPTTTAAPAATSTVAAPSTTVAPVRSWEPIDASTVNAPMAFPCCASNWDGVPSPALPAPGQPLADGVYAISFDWPTDPTQPAAATVRRFEQCTVLPEGSCEAQDSYLPSELGIDPSSSYAVDLPLDDRLGVILTGWDVDRGETRRGTGALLAELIVALDADYATAIGEPLDAGVPAADIAAELQANPANGFGPPPGGDVSGDLVYEFGDAPALLFQALRNGQAGVPPRGSDVIGRISLIVDGDQLTLVTYAGFYS